MPLGSTKEELKETLRSRAADMRERTAALQDEVATTGDDVRAAVINNPWIGVGGALAAGLAVGLLFGGSPARRRQRRYTKLTDKYLDALASEVRASVDAGDDPADALEAALQQRVPLVVHTGDAPASTSWVRAGARALGSAAVGLVLREVLARALEDPSVQATLDEYNPLT
ncbi:hypothetical protein [Salisaeta longa]|uniref:hypothetical protein n=1 Tax=Salisaeta longa TaxID=503170 RepID=UPI0003B425A7|nr:hypothetical protein [Salisaeta longa]